MIIDKVCLLLESQGGTYEISGIIRHGNTVRIPPFVIKWWKSMKRCMGKSPESKLFMPAWNAASWRASCLAWIVCPSARIWKDIHTPEERLRHFFHQTGMGLCAGSPEEKKTIKELQYK